MHLRSLAVAAVMALAACGRPSTPAAMPGLAVADALGSHGDEHAFARATEVPELRFPRDHAAHPDFRTEWWYVTGNLATANGRRFGMQLVFFRQALAPRDPNAPPRTAGLAAREMILAHAAVTDVDGRRFHFAEQLARAAGELAYVRGGGGPDQPFAARCGDWTATMAPGGDGFLPLELRAGRDDFAFALVVRAGDPPVLQGDRGLSQKSDAPGNASIYYSLPRGPIDGTITVGGETHEVRGEAWIDREWSTSALGADQVGWDWFSLQLDDGSEVMWYGLRHRDGSLDRWSRGCVVSPDGVVTPLGLADVLATPEGTWRAPDGGAVYPQRWSLRATGARPFELVVEPLLADQELHTLVRYWEGAVAVRGTRSGRPVAGHGYLEMTGYVRGR